MVKVLVLGAAWRRSALFRVFFLLEVVEFTFEICFIDAALIRDDDDDG